MDGRSPRGDTREKIRAVALELFAEQGYDKTSLREIAERLGVTKAALYYHFKTKEEIVTSMFDDFIVEMDKIIDWAEAQPRTAKTRREIVRRYAGLLQAHDPEMARLMRNHQQTMRDLGARTVERMRRLSGLLHEPDAPLPRRIKATLALVALHFGYAGLEDAEASPQELRDASLQVALDLAR